MTLNGLDLLLWLALSRAYLTAGLVQLNGAWTLLMLLMSNAKPKALLCSPAFVFPSHVMARVNPGHSLTCPAAFP